MNFVRSLTFNVASFLWTFILLFLYLPLLVAPQRWLVEAVRFWVFGIFFLQHRLLNLKFEFRGVHLLPETPYIIASAHQSAWDTIAFYAIVRDPGYIVKNELTKVPLLSAYVRRLGMISINRLGNAGEIRKMIREVRDSIQKRRSIVIFPGGTRSPPGEEVPLKSGINSVYRQCGVPVVPVSLNSGVFWGRRSFLKKSGVIIAEFHPPIEPGQDISIFSEILRDSINSGNRRLLCEALNQNN
ncbi:MAG: lysophospholipid acyltransferase family protein [Pseudomonadota bacterium]|nr:lysophospholipid acyltransferase family protein [Pseudomonadota bacterium]